MGDYASYRIRRVENEFGASDAKPYLDAFKFDAMVRNLSLKSIDGYYERLGYLLQYLRRNKTPFMQTTKRNLQDYILSLKGMVSDETINGRLRVYRRFFNYLVDEGLWEHENPMAGVKLIRAAKKVKPIITPEVFQRVIAAFDRKRFEGNRNLVMTLLLWDGMLRMNEILGLKISNLNLEGRIIKIFGKGRKERMVPCGVKTIKLIHQYLVKWRRHFPGDYLICMRNGQRLRDRQCHKIISGIGKKLDIRLHPHLLRHSAATYFIQQGGSVAILQQILGHSSLVTTQKYVHLTNSDKIKSYESYSPSNCLRI